MEHNRTLQDNLEEVWAGSFTLGTLGLCRVFFLKGKIGPRGHGPTFSSSDKERKREKKNIRNHHSTETHFYITYFWCTCDKKIACVTAKSHILNRKSKFKKGTGHGGFLKTVVRAENCFCKLQTLLTLCLKFSILKYRHQSLATVLCKCHIKLYA